MYLYCSCIMSGISQALRYNYILIIGERGKGGQRAKGAINDILIMTCCRKY